MICPAEIGSTESWGEVMPSHTEKWAPVPERVRGYVTLHLWSPLSALIVQGVVGEWVPYWIHGSAASTKNSYLGRVTSDASWVGGEFTWGESLPSARWGLNGA